MVANVEEAARCDLVIAYLPQASMGTALEMWEAWRAGVPVMAITPLAANWVVRVCAAQRFDTLEDLPKRCRRAKWRNCSTCYLTAHRQPIPTSVPVAVAILPAQ